MTARTRKLSQLLASAALALPISAYAQPPADCSKGPIPNKALQLTIGSNKVPALPIMTLRQGTEKTSGAKMYDQWQISLRDKDRSASTEVRISVLVPHEQKLDGKTFRLLPKADGQPGPEPGLSEVQAWAVEDSVNSLDANNVQFTASLRVEFGKRTADVQPGRVYLCVAGGQTNKDFGTKLADAITLVGRFDAKVR